MTSYQETNAKSAGTEKYFLPSDSDVGVKIWRMWYVLVQSDMHTYHT